MLERVILKLPAFKSLFYRFSSQNWMLGLKENIAESDFCEYTKSVYLKE